MYINYSLFIKSGLSADDLLALLAAKQIEKEVLLTLTEDKISRLEELSLVTYIKGKVNEDKRLKLRLSDKGKELLNNLSFEGAVDSESSVIVDWLIKVYKAKSGGIIKNKQEILRRIHWFKTITQISGNHLALLLQCFINDTYNPDSGESVQEFMKNNPRGVLNNMLDNLAWSPTSIMDKHKTLDKSPLYIYYTNNLEYVKEVWRKNNLE